MLRVGREERRRSLLRIRGREQDWDLYRFDDRPCGIISAPRKVFRVGVNGQTMADTRHLARAVHRLQRPFKALAFTPFFYTGLITASLEPIVAPAGEPYPRVHPEDAEADAQETQATHAREGEIDEGKARHEEEIEYRPKDGWAPGDNNAVD